MRAFSLSNRKFPNEIKFVLKKAMNTEIIEWLNGEKHYAVGLLLLEKYGKNRAQSRIFQKANPKYMSSKLEYELKKLAGIPPAEIFKQKGSNQQLINEIAKKESAPKTTIIKQKRQTIPAIINEAKKIVIELYQRLSIFHQQLYDLGTSNDKTTIEARKKIITERLPIITLYELIYEQKEEFFRSGAVDQQLKENLKIATEIILPTDKVKVLKSSFTGLSDIELLRKKSATASSITKTENMLNYQSITRTATPTPLPEGAKRDKYVSKLKSLKADYKEIMKEIKKRQNG